MNNPRKTIAFATFMLLLSLGLSLLVAEGIARLFSYRPWVPVTRDGEVVTYEDHPVLGWRNREGSYVVPPYSPEGNPIHMTFLADGLRATSREQSNVRDQRPKLVFVGGSFTQGWAISDQETLAWKLQQGFPAFEVLNYGTGGYGTYQSLLTLEEQLPKLSRPRIVFYGFVFQHRLRNVAPGYWLKSLSENSSREVHVPWVTLQDDKLSRQTPAIWPKWPLREYSALVTLAETAWMTVSTRDRFLISRRVTHFLLREMKALTEAYGAELVVVLLNFEKRGETHYIDWFRKKGIATINCNIPLTKELVVIGEGHPNGELNTRWYDCVAAYLEQRGIARGDQH